MNDADCYVANSNCVGSQCLCRDEMKADDDNTACVGMNFSIVPLFCKQLLDISSSLMHSFKYVTLNMEKLVGLDI